MAQMTGGIVFTHRQLEFAKHYATKFFTLDGLQRLAKNPRALYRRTKTFLFDVNLRDTSEAEALAFNSDALTTLSQLVKPPTISFDQWLPVLYNASVSELGDCFKKHGSDKSTSHDYHRIYGSILSAKRDRALNILEVGLGTNNIDIPSNMGLSGKPGASLRAFRDWAPNARIYGADVDRRVLFEDERIQTFWVDQTNQTSLHCLAGEMGEKRFDLIIDDGLHTPISICSAPCCRCSPTTAFSSSRISMDFTPFWKVASLVLATSHDTYFTQCKSAFVFVARHRRP